MCRRARSIWMRRLRGIRVRSRYPAPIVYIGLVDPSGRQAAYSIPQGFNSGYGHVDVVDPVGGYVDRVGLDPTHR